MQLDKEGLSFAWEEAGKQILGKIFLRKAASAHVSFKNSDFYCLCFLKNWVMAVCLGSAAAFAFLPVPKVL